LKHLFSHSSLRGLELDDPHLTRERRQVLGSNRFLNCIYREWYTLLADSIPSMDGGILELGSGAGFLREFIPGVITSEIFHISDVSVILDGERLPFTGGSLRAVVMTDVLHHIPNPRSFFCEAGRCIRPGGVVSMIEPWNTPWSKLAYNWLHHEPFLPQALTWEFPSSGPLSGANGANPWIIFHRDRHIFEKEFPTWQIERIQPMYPLRYLLSGGISRRNLAPAWSYTFWRRLEEVFKHWSVRSAMFALVILRLKYQ